jgi:hypothetical protein
MHAIDDVRIYNESCPPLGALLRKIKQRPAKKLGPSVMPVDERYAAGVWKRLFLLALERMATQQESLARLTAVEALRILGSSASPSQHHPQTESARYLLSIFGQTKDQPLRGRTSPRSGFHPLDIQRWTSDAMHVFRDDINKRDAADLWKRCSGEQMPKTLMGELQNKRTPLARARTFVSRLVNVTEGGLRVTLHRQRRARKPLQ